MALVTNKVDNNVMTKLKMRIANRIRKISRRPVMGERRKIYVLPWVAGNGLSTLYLFNGMRDKSIREHEVNLALTQYGPDGSILAEDEVPLGHAKMFNWKPVAPAQMDEISIGYTAIEQRAEGKHVMGLQHHFQVTGPGSMTMTHGRPKGIFFYPLQTWQDNLISSLDPRPHSQFVNVVPVREACQSLALFNLSNKDCWISFAPRLLEVSSVMLPPFGAKMLPISELQGCVDRLDLFGSAPFSFYVAMSRQDGQGFSIQHIREAI